MNTLQVKLEKTYHVRLMDFCQRNGASKADAIRYMIDTLQLSGANDAEFDRWFDTRQNAE